jgi:hypothetical protein
MAEGGAASARYEGLTLRAYRQGDEEGIFALFQTTYGKPRSPASWRWKFCENPAGLQIVLAVTGDGEVVGQYAGMPAWAAIGGPWAAKDGRPYLLSQAVESMVNPRFRRGLKNPGLQIRLVRRFYEEYMGPDAGAMAYGFPIPVYCRLLVRTGVVTVLHRVVQLEKDLTSQSGRSGRRLPAVRYRIEQFSRYSSAVDELWQRCQRELPMAVIRNARYLNWRYADCPDVAYVKLLATDRWTGRAEGIAVLRLGFEDRPVASLVDWLVPRRRGGLAGALLRHCEAVAVASGQRRIEAWFPDYAPQFQFLQANGYRPSPTQYEIVWEPFQPELARDWVPGHWYYTMGDSDIY